MLHACVIFFLLLNNGFNGAGQDVQEGLGYFVLSFFVSFFFCNKDAKPLICFQNFLLDLLRSLLSLHGAVCLGLD